MFFTCLLKYKNPKSFLLFVLYYQKLYLLKLLVGYKNSSKVTFFPNYNLKIIIKKEKKKSFMFLNIMKNCVFILQIKLVNRNLKHFFLSLLYLSLSPPSTPHFCKLQLLVAHHPLPQVILHPSAVTTPTPSPTTVAHKQWQSSTILPPPINTM